MTKTKKYIVAVLIFLVGMALAVVVYRGQSKDTLANIDEKPKVVEQTQSDEKPQTEVTLETLLADGKLPDGLIVGKSTNKEIVELYGQPSESVDYDGGIAMIYKDRTFVVTTSGLLLTAAYNEDGSILGLTTRKSTQDDVKALLGSRFSIIEDEEDLGDTYTWVSNEAGNLSVSFNYDTDGILLSISIISK